MVGPSAVGLMVQLVAEGVVRHQYWLGSLAEEHSVVRLIRCAAEARRGRSPHMEAVLAPWVGAVAP